MFNLLILQQRCVQIYWIKKWRSKKHLMELLLCSNDCWLSSFDQSYKLMSASSKVSNLNEALNFGLYSFEVGSWLFYVSTNLRVFVECWAELFARPNSQQKSNPHLQKMLPCKHPCHTWCSWLENPWQVVNLKFHALDGSDCTDRPQVTWDLRPFWTDPRGRFALRWRKFTGHDFQGVSEI